jgi:hypothetical protein
MKELAVFVLGVVTALAGAYAYQHHHHATAYSGPLTHVRNEFEFMVQAPYAVTAPLFGPEGERAWAGKDWAPHFLYPQPAQDIQGAVFTVQHGHHSSYWVNTSFDKDTHQFQYVYFIPDAMVTLIDVRFAEVDGSHTKVNVIYERTALSPQANDHVREMGNSDRDSGKEWEKAVNSYLAKAVGR